MGQWSRRKGAGRSVGEDRKELCQGNVGASQPGRSGGCRSDTGLHNHNQKPGGSKDLRSICGHLVFQLPKLPTSPGLRVILFTKHQANSVNVGLKVLISQGGGSRKTQKTKGQKTQGQKTQRQKTKGQKTQSQKTKGQKTQRQKTSSQQPPTVG